MTEPEKQHDNGGWNEAKEWVKDSLGRLENKVDRIEGQIDRKLSEVYRTLQERAARWHVAPCQDIISIREDSGKQDERIKALEENQKETTSGVRWLIGIGLTIVGLLFGVLYKGG